MKYRGTFDDWQVVTRDTFRLRVYGGWKVMTLAGDTTVAIFVPDPHHEWVVEKMER